MGAGKTLSRTRQTPAFSAKLAVPRVALPEPVRNPLPLAQRRRDLHGSRVPCEPRPCADRWSLCGKRGSLTGILGQV